MKIFVVGGAVRDELLGLAIKDRDFVVVGATPEEMLARRFRPVGKDFPVFLHPDTQEEYALARTERKTAPGYKGFVFHADPDVTLEQDLIRRDLTINAIARGDDGAIVDPFGGQADLQARIFRHVSDAFAEDPVRILRVARFAARFTEFSVAPETNALMQQMVGAGEVDALVPERVWQELSRGLMDACPSRMFEVLRGCGALARILPELNVLWGVPQPEKYHPEIDTGKHVMMVIDMAAKENMPLPVRFAALMHDLGKGVTPVSEWPSHHGHEGLGVKLVEQVCKRLKVQSEVRDLAVMTTREHGNIGRAFALRAKTIVTLFGRCDAFRKPQRFLAMLDATECDYRGRTGYGDLPFPQKPFLQAVLRAAQSVNAGEIAGGFAHAPQRIPDALHAARTAAVEATILLARPTLPKPPHTTDPETS
ncbi:multifunctional CCA addition/repair protein [Glaciimonas sp. CA11.2]|uniref:multifunctional CCA addition/repair protein n=1 Tax=unclassified Glaciimonas TaxID=2644401 RepID=UPI002AB5465D|nr:MULTISPECIES: multifunctional CCA addition/repair protein [unclassified Glaciimonas]MDY7546413.1 multifunctional CCA addition/repair protein [Glaciimonas sp. CA11.2]MEB0014083.1 multifunctional CCA addition/repair protein [Glaciimonas sp. Cout2]MEB0083415.1 multifunctional CCA addition/repair protein [Glaciimonas sp. Gout2]MEB0162589.1 multifunctional CCA addition/repair protein [Glaciimonas sp. CA11.2]